MKDTPRYILLVEPDPVVAEALTSTLEARGHSVVSVRAGSEALLAPHPEVLITDLDLPDYDSFTLLRILRDRGSAPAGIFLARDPSIEARRHLMCTGRTRLLRKPVDPRELLRSVAEENSVTDGFVLGQARDAASEQPHESAEFFRTFECSPLAVDEAAREISAFALKADIGPTLRARLGTAMCEVLDNVVQHAYPEGGGRMRIEMHVEPRRIVASVTDDGIGFDPALSVLVRGDSGGLQRARALVEELDIETWLGGGTRIELTVDAFRADFDDASSIDMSELDYFTPEIVRRVLTTLDSPDSGDIFVFSPALAVVVGRLLNSKYPATLDSLTL